MCTHCRTWLFLIITASMLWVVACTSSGDAGHDGTEQCIPGRTLDCPCTGEVSGVQVCQDDATFGECQCADGEEPVNATNHAQDAGVDDVDPDVQANSPDPDATTGGDTDDDPDVGPHTDADDPDVGPHTDIEVGPDADTEIALDASDVENTDVETFEPLDEIPAFPGAEGWGATALKDCRALPVVVHQVTNTDDSGPGSLRHILENQINSSNYDVVLFQTGGIIESVSTQTVVRRNCVYIAGQTAPGDGITIRSHPNNGHNGHLIRFNQRQNLVIRFLRLRHGQEGDTSGGGIITTGKGNGRGIIYDHLSASWGGGNTMLQIATSDLSNPDHTLRGSVQNSISAEGFENRAASFRATGGGGDSHWGLRQMSFFRNLTALAGQRHPAVRAGDSRVSTSEGVEVVNNVMFGAKNRFTEGNDHTVLDFVNNYQDAGPHRSYPYNRWSKNSGQPIPPDDPEEAGSLFTQGNVAIDFDGTQWEMWRDHSDGTSLLPDTFLRTTRLDLPPFPIYERTAEEARQWILENAGASLKLDCSGHWVPNRDEVDQRIIDYVTTASPEDTPVDAFGMTVDEIHGQWPIVDPGTPCEDTNGDGIPDGWYERWGYDPADPPPIDTQTESGYLLIEHYLNNSDPDHPAPSLVVAPGIEP